MDSCDYLDLSLQKPELLKNFSYNQSDHLRPRISNTNTFNQASSVSICIQDENLKSS